MEKTASSKLDWAAIWDEALGEDSDTPAVDDEDGGNPSQSEACQPPRNLGYTHVERVNNSKCARMNETSLSSEVDSENTGRSTTWDRMYSCQENEDIATELTTGDGGPSKCLTPLVSLQNTSGNGPRRLFPIFDQALVGSRARGKKRKLEESGETDSKASLAKKSRGASVKKRRAVRDKLEQLHLDLGQKSFGHVTCKVCGMVYTFGQGDDETEHIRFHRKFVSGVKFAGWKKERVVRELYDGRVILVLPSDPKHHLRKVEELCRVVDSELGYAVGPRLTKSTMKVYLYISTRKSIMGCIFAEEINEGFRIVTVENRTLDCRDLDLSAWFCSVTPEPAMLGINRMWVSSHFRRLGVATRLLDTVRSTITSGSVVPKDKVAFSDPTPDGRAFASKYCGSSNFLVYRWT